MSGWGRLRSGAQLNMEHRLMRARVYGMIGRVLTGLLVAAGCEGAYASGFRNPVEGASAVGMTGGKTALLDDATAVVHNPANLADLEGPQLMESLAIIYGEIDYTGASGSGTTDDPWKFLPGVFYAAPLSAEGLSAGISITSPYGQSTDWGRSGPFGFSTPYFAEMRTVNVRPVLAFRISEQLSVGAGPDVLYSDLTLKQLYPWGMVTGNPMAPMGDLRLEGDGFGVGGTAALAWRPAERHRVGLAYHSPVKLEYEGDLDVSNVPPPSALPGPLGLVVGATSSFDTEITFPSLISLGYGYEVTPALRLGLDLEWVEFSTFDELPLDVGRNNPLLQSPTVPQQWDDTWVIAAGAEYDVSEALTVRGGYVFLESPVPEQTLAPSLPDANRHMITAGLTARTGPHALGAAYVYTLVEDLEVTDNLNPLFNGDYDFNQHLLVLSYAYTF